MIREAIVAPVAQSVSAPYLKAVHGARDAEVVSSNLTWSIFLFQMLSLGIQSLLHSLMTIVRMAEWSKAPDSRMRSFGQ